MFLFDSTNQLYIGPRLVRSLLPGQLLVLEHGRPFLLERDSPLVQYSSFQGSEEAGPVDLRCREFPNHLVL